MLVQHSLKICMKSFLLTGLSLC
ncbi:MAG: hypothetical protein RIT36_1693, partial [Bacteroidota bacterium]